MLKFTHTFIFLQFKDEGSYYGTVSVYNPIDGWLRSDTFTLVVSEEIGPITITDSQFITDKV